MTMKICYATLGYPFGGGGISTYVYYIAHALAERGHEVHVFVVGERSTVEQDNGVTVHHCSLPKWMTKLNFVPLMPNITNSVAISKAIEQIENDKPMIVEFPDHGALGLTYVLKKRFQPSRTRSIVKLHTSTKLAWLLGGLKTNVSVEAIDALERIPIRLADGLTAPSQSIGEVSREQYRLTKTVPVIPYAIDTDFWSPGNTVDIDELMENPRIAFAGRFEKRKGIDVLLDAMKQIWRCYPKVTFVLVGSTAASFGEPEFREIIDRQIETLSAGGNVKIHEWVTKEALRELYRHATLAIVPSRYDNLPYGCLEPLSCGTPIIASRVGGIPSIVGEEGGMLVPPEDADALANAVCELLANRARLAKLRDSARKRAVELFSYQAIVHSTITYYEEVLESNDHDAGER